jgi:hypothetical protein
MRARTPPCGDAILVRVSRFLVLRVCIRLSPLVHLRVCDHGQNPVKARGEGGNVYIVGPSRFVFLR